MLEFALAWTEVCDNKAEDAPGGADAAAEAAEAAAAVAATCCAHEVRWARSCACACVCRTDLSSSTMARYSISFRLTLPARRSSISCASM